MNGEMFERLADALEAIGTSLSEISAGLNNINQALDGCISHVGDNSFLCITGNISNY
ncbi:MAG: hypothetical protein K1W10_07985 [Lachnospiraceae bacterium]